MTSIEMAPRMWLTAKYTDLRHDNDSDVLDLSIWELTLTDQEDSSRVIASNFLSDGEEIEYHELMDDSDIWDFCVAQANRMFGVELVNAGDGSYDEGGKLVFEVHPATALA